MANIGKVSAVFTASSSGLTAGVSRASSSLKGLKSDVSSLRSGMQLLNAISGAQLFGSVISGAASATKTVIGLGSSFVSSMSSAVESATSLGEETSKSGVIFGDSAAQVAEFAKQASRIGLAESVALSATGNFGNLFTAMGLGKDQAASYATTLTSLGADLASFNNSSVDDAVGALGAALRGESEPIRRFGVLLDDATLKQQALSMGLIQSTSGSLSPAIKAQAAYAAILKQTSAAQGDFERTSGSLANLGRIVSAQTTNVFTTIGTAFEPLYKAIASGASSVLTAIEPLFGQIASGVKGSVEVIAASIESLIPQFTAFIGTVNGADIGSSIGEGILDGAEFLAGIGDYLISNFGSVFEYLSGVGEQWGGVFNLASKIGNVMTIAGNGVAMTIRAVVLLFSNLVEQAISVVSMIPGVGSALEGVAATVKGFNEELNAGALRNFEAMKGGLSDLMGESGDKTGAAIAGPLTKAFQEFRATSRDSAAAVDVAKKQTVDVAKKQTISALVEPAGPNSAALTAIDSRSKEGIAEMFRLMRGDGADIQAQQLAAQERMADGIEDMAGNEMEVLSMGY